MDYQYVIIYLVSLKLSYCIVRVKFYFLLTKSLTDTCNRRGREDKRWFSRSSVSTIRKNNVKALQAEDEVKFVIKAKADNFAEKLDFTSFVNINYGQISGEARRITLMLVTIRLLD